MVDSEYMRFRYHRRRAQIFAIIGNSCAVCGCKENLEIDHIDPATKSFEVADNTTLSIESLMPELEKCQPLCKACHRGKTNSEQTVGHGGGKSGKRRCKCDLCRAKKREYMREYMRGVRLKKKGK